MVCSVCSVVLLTSLILCEATINDKVTREVDLTTPVTRIKHEIIAKDVSSSYVFSVHSSEAPHLAHISAHLTSQPKSVLKVSKISDDNGFVVEFDGNQQTRSFTVVCVYSKLLRPRPSKRAQSEPQFVKYSGNLLFYTPYITAHQETIVKLNGGNILDYTKNPKPKSKSSSQLTYGPFTDKEPLLHVPLDVHLEFRHPMLVVTEMTRLIEVSHWGNIAVEDSVELANQCARLHGPFSRLDFDNGIGQKEAVTSFKTALPAAAKDIYYRDQIGNISTSAVRELLDSTEVTVTPRFPLLGGWKTEYILGYNVPAYEFLYRSGPQFKLQMRFVDHIYDDQLIQELTVKIVLPELVQDVHVDLPYPVKRQSREVMKTYLDTVGRTVLVFKASNLVTEHIVDFVVNYRFSMLLMLREPLMLIVGFLCLFAFVMIYVRLDFSIYKDEKTELQMQVQSLVDEALRMCHKRFAIYEGYEKSIRQFKLSKDTNAFVAGRRRLEMEHKQTSQAVSASASAMAELYPSSIEKMRELNMLDQKYRDLLQQSVQQAERLVSGKMSKADYQVAHSEVSSLKSDVANRMETVMDSL